MNIKLNIDSQELTGKPAEFDGRLRLRLCSKASIREVTPDQLIECVKRGRSFTPSVMTGTSGKTWQSQQIICADIDNDDGKKNMIEDPMTPARAAAVMEKYGIYPYFMYYTFSNTENWPKFRIVLVLNKPIEDHNIANDLTVRFAGIFNHEADHCADTSIKDSARLFYGGKADSVFYTSKKQTSIDLLQALPVFDDTEATEARETQKEYKRPPERQNGEIRPYSVLQALFEADKKSFDLAAYVESTTNSKPVRYGQKLFFNPCPICGHNNDFQVTDSVYHDWGANGGTSGSIIDYLVNKEGLTVGEACDKFKYEIMGYDCDEWRQAYIAEKYPQTDTDGDGILGWDSEISEPGDAPAAADQIDDSQPATEITNTRPHNVADYIRNLMADEIEVMKAQSDRRTGFPNLDAEAGSIYAGLYVLGGLSSLGKTTFIGQLADQMAALGQHVLFFSMEQSRLEMVCKSISRQTASIDPMKAVTSMQIRNGFKNDIVQKATAAYLYSVGDRISILEGNFNCTVSRIRKYVEDYMKQNDGVKPVVIIDYLQVLQPDKDPETGRKMTDIRMIVDHNLTELRRMSRSFSIPVIVLSSMNRNNYLTPIEFEAFKESGGIEYTADVVWGLQLAAIHEDLFNGDPKTKVKEKRERIAAAKDAIPRDIELVCLKNRFGKSRYFTLFTYYPQFDYFVPQSK